VGIDRHEGRALPADKAARVSALRAEGRRVLYVGDGVNDGPALAAADAGLAMRHGASMALEAAGLLSIRDEPGSADTVIRLARRLRRVTLQNYLWAIGYNLALVPVAAAG
jgi:P-type E1-E2 ATPase